MKAAREIRLSCLFVCATLALVASPRGASAQSRDADDYLFLLEKSANITTDSVANGSVGVNEPGGLLIVSRGAAIAGGTQAVADRVKLGRGARVFDLFANTLSTSRDSLIAGTLTQPILPPIYASEPLIVPDPFDPANYPPAFPITCGGPSKIGGQDEAFALTPGSYESLTLAKGGRATLLPGTYNFCTFRIIKGDVAVTGPVTINVRDVFAVGIGSTLVPVGSGLSANDVVINMAGKLFRAGGPNGIVNARVFAPDALLKIGRSASVTGHFVASRLRGDHSFTAIPEEPPACGNGALDPGETCDPPQAPQPPNGNACRSDCTFCGDGLTQPGEECDDANAINTDACRNNCTLPPPPMCGNNQLDAGETCDPPGADPGPPGGNLCRTDCTYCGDGVPQASEACDDENTNDGDGCRNDCTLPVNACGDLQLDPGETCDPPGSDPPPPGGNLCRLDCTYCGDGLTQPGEECDDGNASNGDACENDCTLPPPPSCGNTLPDPGETCDPPGSDPPPPGGNLCRLNCTFCGDGVTNGGELCDDANTNENDGCRSDCTTVPFCGDGQMNQVGETCDPPGSDPPPPGGNLCRLDCTFCGDGVAQAGEACDDGNPVDNDACRNDCTVGFVCGDNVLNQASETCDPPGSDPAPPGGNLCRVNCTYCGDGQVQAGEECDDGNTDDGDGCRNDCTVQQPPICGDLQVNAPGETCDPPGSDPPPAGGNPCRVTCTYCGDGQVNDAEQCDDANTNDNDACRNDCTFGPPPPVCGDGVINQVSETCDPPGSDPAPAGGNLCRVGCTYCGDNLVNGGEQCDDGNTDDGDACRNDCTLPPPAQCLVDVEKTAAPDEVTGTSPPNCTGKVQSITLRYTGAGCAASDNPQSGKATCTGGANGAQPVRILIRDKKSASTVYGDVSGVTIGGTATGTAANAGKTTFGAESRVQIFNGGGQVIEDLLIHTSCSQRLDLGDHFGSLEVISMTTTEGGQQDLGATITYTYTVMNLGNATLLNVTLVDNLLGTVPGTPIASIPPGGTVVRTASAFVSDTTTNTVTAGANISGGQTCGDTDSSTVTRVTPPMPPAACDGDHKVGSITFRYTGEGCSASNNPQSGKAICTGGANFAQPVRILIRDLTDGSIVYGDVLTVNLNGSATGAAANAGLAQYKTNALVRIFNGGGAVVEENTIHTSCSQPLAVGDKFGSLEVIALGLVPR